MEQATKAGIEQLQGTWRLIRSVAAGHEGASPEGTFLVINNQKFERRTPDFVYRRDISINTDFVPFQIDLHITNEPDLGKTFLGIFKLEGDVLTIAHSQPGNPRTTVFESTKENKQILSVSQKVV